MSRPRRGLERSVDKETAEIVKVALRRGAVLTAKSRGGHRVLVLPNGARVSVPTSRNGRQSARNLALRLRLRGLDVRVPS